MAGKSEGAAFYKITKQPKALYIHYMHHTDLTFVLLNAAVFEK